MLRWKRKVRSSWMISYLAGNHTLVLRCFASGGMCVCMCVCVNCCCLHTIKLKCWWLFQAATLKGRGEGGCRHHAEVWNAMNHRNGDKGQRWRTSSSRKAGLGDVKKKSCLLPRIHTNLKKPFFFCLRNVRTDVAQGTDASTDSQWFRLTHSHIGDIIVELFCRWVAKRFITLELYVTSHLCSDLPTLGQN